MVTITDLSIGYGHKAIASGITLSLASNRLYGLFGVNGVGKTTLLRTLAGAISPLSGSIDAFSYVPFERKKQFLSDTILIENGISLPAITAKKFARIFSSFYPRFSHERYIEYSRELGIGSNDALSKLSMGKRQCFALSFALACQARLTLLDEPMASLDIISRQNLIKILARGDNEDGIMVISSHDTAGLDNIVSDIVVMREAQPPLCASIEDIGHALAFHEEGIWPDTLYENGLQSISMNSDGFESDIDIALLFRALISDKYFTEKFNSLISSTPCDN